MNLIEQIKARVSIGDVLGFCGVKMNNGFILSPYRREKSPSCKIYLKSNTFKDYSSEEQGDQIDLFCVLTNKSKPDAIKDLAGYAQIQAVSGSPLAISGLPLGVSRGAIVHESMLEVMSEDERGIYDERLAISDSELEALRDVRMFRLEENVIILKAFAEYCRDKGWDSMAMEYLCTQRGFSEDMVRSRLLFVKDYFEVNNHFKKWFDMKALKRCGLFNEKGNLIFAFHRIVIPYFVDGRIIYLRGRYFDKDGNAKTDKMKYTSLKDDGLGINTGRRFYNTDVLKKVVPGMRIYITEGEFDALLMEDKGFAALGVPGVGNLPPVEKFKRLLKYDICIVPDNDSAGGNMLEYVKRDGTRVGIRVIMEELGKRFKIKRLPEGVKDFTDFMVINEK